MTPPPFSLVCPEHRQSVLSLSGDNLICPACGRTFSRNPVPDLLGYVPEENPTAAHYTKQWGSPLGFNRFLEKNKKAELVTMGKQLGWPKLFDNIRRQAETQEVKVFDAACGRGAIFLDLFRAPIPGRLYYLGADIHGALGDIQSPERILGEQAFFVRWDISEPLPVAEKFDYVICRASVHHTPDPARTLRSLKEALKPGGVLAISVYTKKAPMREAVDTALREMIVPLPSEEAYSVCRQLSVLGRDLQKTGAKITISEDLPFLGISSGEHELQSFIYEHLIKCWYNDQFGIEHSTAVNFDWYHPAYAYRFSEDELYSLVEEAGLVVAGFESNKYQHYAELRAE